MGSQWFQFSRGVILGAQAEWQPACQRPDPRIGHFDGLRPIPMTA